MPHMRERIPHPDDRPDEGRDKDRDELPQPDPAAGVAERPSTDALEEPAPPEQVETEVKNERTSEDF